MYFVNIINENEVNSSQARVVRMQKIFVREISFIF